MYQPDIKKQDVFYLHIVIDCKAFFLQETKSVFT